VTPFRAYNVRFDGVLLREIADTAGRLRVERWDAELRTWVHTGRAVWDYDDLPLATLAQMQAAGYDTAAIEADAEAEGWTLPLSGDIL